MQLCPPHAILSAPDTFAYAIMSARGFCIRNRVLRIVLHRGHNCIRHNKYPSHQMLMAYNRGNSFNWRIHWRIVTKIDLISA